MSSSSDLPSSREFVTKLLASLNTLPPHAADVTTTTPLTTTPAPAAAASNPLSHASEAVKKHLLTLHVLFPNELLPALDLLDRRLVTRCHIQHPEAATSATAAQQYGSSTSTNAVVPCLKTDSKQPSPHLLHPSNTTETQDKKQSATLDSTPTSHPAAPTTTTGTNALTTPARIQPPDSGLQAPGTSDQALGPSSLAPTTSHPSPDNQEKHISTVAVPATATDTRTQAHGHANPDLAPQPEKHPRTQPKDTVYYVRSAQHRSSRFSAAHDTNTSYEVRLRAWNCSCPAFAFSAFPPVFHHNHHLHHQVEDRNTEVRHAPREWSFGGLSREDGANSSSSAAAAPVCKHLLACVLAERCESLFGGFVADRVVGLDEAAGWAAGWGD